MGDKVTLTIKDQVNVKFDGLPPEIRRKISEECKYVVPYARHTPQYKLGRWDGKVAFSTIGGSTFINMLDKVLPIVIDAGFEVDIIDQRPQYHFEWPEVTEELLAHKTWPEGHPAAGEPIMLRDYQVAAIKSYLDNPQSIQAISTGAGKAQPMWSKIKTPSGWTTMGEISIGDDVSTPDGGSAKVIGLYPQGEKEYYRVEFVDGRVVEACGEHLWDVHVADWKGEKRTLTTKQVMERINTTKRPVYVPLTNPHDRPDGDFFIHPYVMGVILGDGGISQRPVVISTKDQEIINRVSSLLDNRYILKHHSGCDYRICGSDDYRAEKSSRKKGSRDKTNAYSDELIRLGLKGTKSNNKFIPMSYIDQASVEQRYELLRGLIDTDGHIGINGEISFTTVSPLLRDGVAHLVYSLGGTAKITNRITHYKNSAGEKKAGQVSYTIRIRVKEPKKVSHLSRKLARLPDNYQYADSLKLRVSSIKKVGKTECQCIMVDHPDHLYITDNYVVTHNTITTAALSTLVEPYGRSIVIVPSKSLVLQTEEDYRNLGLDVGVFYGDRKEWGHTHTICTWQSLGAFSKRSKSNLDDLDEDQFSRFIDDVVCVMIDEVHSAKADVLKNLLTGPMSRVPIRWGLTGTIPKEEFEFKALECSIGCVVGETTAKSLQDRGILSNCHINILQLNDDHVGFNTYDSEYKYLTTDKERLTYMVELCLTIAESGNTLILVDRIETGRFLVEHLGDKAVFISGDTKMKNRSKEFKEVQNTDGKIIVATYGVAAVGINVNRLFNLVLIEPGKSFVRVIQSIGRGLRTAKDKDFVNVYDITSSLKFSKKHLTQRKKYYKDAQYPHTVTKVAYR